MKQDTAVRRGHPILFGLLLLFGIIEGATTSYLGELWHPQGGRY